MHGLTAGRRDPDGEAFGVERRALVVQQERLEALPGAQPFGGARGGVAAYEDGRGVVDVDGVTGRVAQHDADAHAFAGARRGQGRRLVLGSLLDHVVITSAAKPSGKRGYRPAYPSSQAGGASVHGCRLARSARAGGVAGGRPARVGYTPLVMIVPEAIEQLDSLRERLHGASERLSWLRSYL